MNRLLASIVGFLNGLLAFVFIIGGALIGHSQLDSMGLVLGLVTGVIFSIIVCGVLAIFISMRNELIAIRHLLNKQSKQVPSVI